MKVIREELSMDYSPILGVTYGLKNVEVDEEWDEDHALSLVLNEIIEDLEKEDEKKEK